MYCRFLGAQIKFRIFFSDIDCKLFFCFLEQSIFEFCSIVQSTNGFAECMAAANRSTVLSLYRQILKFTRNWKAGDKSEAAIAEKKALYDEARQKFTANKEVSPIFFLLN